MKRRVLVTAGAGGIGRAIAGAFVQAGDEVFVGDVSETALQAALADGLQGCLCDVGDRGQVAGMVATAVAAMGGIDVLVNNAGVSGPTAPLHEMAPDEWDAVLRVNLTGTFLVTRLCVPYLIASGSGVIINMSSAAGRFGYPNRSPYAATKWGLIGLTKTLAMELGAHNVRVNAILPGYVDGERLQRVYEGRSKASGMSLEEVQLAGMAKQSIKRLVDPKEIAALAVFLASDEAKSISGQALPVDGDLQSN
jgi:NAD(P)-dependent dehydrogenase (short-subunit alcohol dehydrogenase family)